jgi:methionine--tRNA ligase beta chain
MITFDEWEKVDVRVGEVKTAAKVEGSDKLIKLEVDFGEEKRQIVAGIAEFYEPDELVGRQCPFLFNLEPRRLRGIESQGMILAVDADGDRKSCALMFPDKQVKNGAKVV